MKKQLLLLVGLLWTLVGMAQWTKPMPVRATLTAEETLYLFNEDYEGFLIGANDWGTRASLSRTAGYQVKMVKYEHDGAWDGQSYVLTDFAESKGEWRFMDLQGIDGTWIDREMDNTKNFRVLTLLPQGDNVYEIGLSDGNKDFPEGPGFTPVPCDEYYPGARFVASPKMKNNKLYWVFPGDGAADGNTDLYGTMDEVCKRWCFVTPADYEAYLVAAEQYRAAMSLGKSIDEAKAQFPGVDISAVTAVYGNTKSTAAQLQAAEAKLREILAASATPENGVNMTNCIVNPGYDNNDNTGWEGTAPSFQNFGNAEFYSKDYDYYQKLTGLKNGVYKVSVTGYYRAGSADADAEAFEGDLMTKKLGKMYVTTGAHHTIYGLPFITSGATPEPLEGSNDISSTSLGYVPNNMETGAVYMAAGQYAPTFITCYVNDGNLTIGLKKESTLGGDWTLFDSWTLTYLGDSDESFRYLANECITREVNYQTLVESGELKYYQHSAYAEYLEALSVLKSSSDPQELAKALSTFNAAAQTLAASAEAYEKYADLYETAHEWCENNTSQTESADLLYDYLYDEAATGYNGNGGGKYILTEGPLTAEQVKAELTYLEKIYSDALSNSMTDGTVCTDLLKNPNFVEAGGWSSAAGISWPVGDVATFPVFEAYGRVCDVYQELKGLQNGLYEMSLQAVYNPEGDADIRQTYAYINSYDTKIGITDPEHPVTNPETASAAFAAGAYPVQAYGIVTDGTMRIGITNRLRTGETAGLWAGGVKLIFRAKNAEALQTMIESLSPEAQTLYEDAKCGYPEKDELMAAIKAAAEAEDGPSRYDAVIALKDAMDAVREGVDVYQNLEVALFQLEQAILNAPATADKVTIDAAQKYLDEQMAAYGEYLLSSDEAKAAIEQLGTYTVAIKMGKTIASEENPVDMSTVIVNNTFDPSMGSKDEKRIDGWVVSGALNGYKSYTCSFNKGTFDLHQDLSGLPKGKYKVTVHSYYRAGSYEEEEANINAGKDTHLMKLYANTSDDNFEGNVMNLSEGSKDVTLPEGISTRVINGIAVPDGTGASATCYAAGLFLNELVFTVGEDGKATIGLRLPETIGTNDYTVVGEWNLWYMGDPSASEEVTEKDLTDLIVNNNFDPAEGSKDEKRINGWVVEGALNGYKSYSCSFNKGTFDLHQDLTGLPAGKYKVTVNTFYRAGSYEEEEANINAGKDTHLMKLYAKASGDEFVTSVMNLSEGSKDVTLPEGISTRVINGITVPDGTGASVACYEAGLFLNELEFTVAEDGKATIGLRLPETIGTNDYTVVGPWHLYYYGAASSEEMKETDISSLIVNSTFDPSRGSKDEKRIDGWVVSGALNGYKSNSCSFNKGTFDLHQDLAGLEEGTYKVTVHTFYRAGSYEEEEANINAGKDTHLMKLYAKASGEEYVKSIVNLSEGSKDVTLPEGISTRVINGITVPDGTGASVACFAEGLFLNELPFYVDNTGKATIGLRLPETIGTNDYTVIGEWNLYYYGKGNHVDELGGKEPNEDEDVPGEDGNAIQKVEPTVVPVEFYSLDGVRLSAPQRGINLIRMPNGSVRKVLVK